MPLFLEPSKVSPTGEKEDLSYYPVDRAPGVLSAAVLIPDMQRLDPRPSPPEQVPLFVDPAAGLEITYFALSSFLDYWLRRAGCPELATGTHALRIGGKTGVANLCADGALLTGLMGSWTSTTKYRYVWAMRHRVKEAARTTARPYLACELAGRPGPVGRVASGRPSV
jgi:hypothetical protein